MSDTPRTEIYVLYPLPQVVSANWARQLERELNAANERIKRLEDGDAALTYSIGLDLQKENEALKARIKRLEEALEECDWAFTKFCPEHESRYGDAWEKVRDALNRPNPFKPYWQEAKP